MKPRVLEIFKRLIAFDTVSSESNLALIEYVRELLLGKGIESLIVKDESGRKANLFASTGPRELPGSCCPGTPTWCPPPARPGACRRSRSRSRAGACTGAAAAT